jgi:hypothetical protein
MNDESKRVRMQWWRNQFTIPAYAWRNRRQSRKTLVRTVGIQAKIRTENFSNGSLQRYIYINLFGENKEEIKPGLPIIKFQIE